MRSRLSVLLALAGFSCIAHAAPWTIDRAIATALEQSPDARLARARIDGAEALVDQARAAWRPQLSLSSRYSETNSPMMAFGSILNQRAFSPRIDFNHPGQIDNLNATGTVAYQIYGGGRATAGRSAARAGAEAAEFDRRATLQDLSAAVVKSALDLHKSRAALATVAGGVRAYAAAVEVARARFDAGQMLKADLRSLEVQLAQTRETELAARHQVALAAHAFRYLIGLEPSDEPLEMEPDDPALNRLTAPTSRDVSGRPELRGLQARQRAAEAMVEAARAGRRPTVNAFASYEYNRGWTLEADATGWLAGVSVDLNLFDGGQTAARVRERRAELAQVKAQLQKATLGLQLEAERARLAHADAGARVAVTRQAVEQAEESAALTRARFERQAVLTADVIGAESRLLEARLRHTLAVSDERLAVVELRRALGLEPLPAP